jgi:NAD dependent epimerase/dehydratase family
VKKFFYSSSACIYPEYNQLDPDNPKCSEDSAYPAAPDSEYGWEKLFSERLCLAYMRNYGVQVPSSSNAQQAVIDASRMNAIRAIVPQRGPTSARQP